MASSTYSHLRENLADIWDAVESTQEPVIVERRGHQAMAILPANELESLRETAHLLRSPKNAARLFAALEQALHGTAPSVEMDALRKDLGLAAEG
jgi:antitoxin YefM